MSSVQVNEAVDQNFFTRDTAALMSIADGSGAGKSRLLQELPRLLRQELPSGSTSRKVCSIHKLV